MTVPSVVEVAMRALAIREFMFTPKDAAVRMLDALSAAGYMIVHPDTLPMLHSPDKTGTYYLLPDRDDPPAWTVTDQPPEPWVVVNPQDDESMRAAGFEKVWNAEWEVYGWLAPEASTG